MSIVKLDHLAEVTYSPGSSFPNRTVKVQGFETWIKDGVEYIQGIVPGGYAADANTEFAYNGSIPKQWNVVFSCRKDEIISHSLWDGITI